MEERKFWKTKVWGIEDNMFFGLIKKVNDFYIGKFTISTQIFHDEKMGRWHAAIFYKEQDIK